MQDEPGEPGAEGREKPDEPEQRDAPKKRPNVVSIVQQNAVIVNGRIVAPRSRSGEWI